MGALPGSRKETRAAAGLSGMTGRMRSNPGCCRSAPAPAAPGGLAAAAGPGAAAAHLERGQQLFESGRRGRRAGGLRRGAARATPRIRARTTCAGVALEKKGDAGGGRGGLPAGRRARARSWPRRATTWAACCWPAGTAPAAEREFARGRQGQPELRRRPLQPGRAARPERAATPRRWPPTAQAVRLKPAEVSYPAEPGGGPPAQRRPRGRRAGAAARRPSWRPRSAPAWANLGLLLSDKKELRRGPRGAGQGDQARSELRRGLGRPGPGGAAAQAAGGRGRRR